MQTLPYIFERSTIDQLIQRIEQLTPHSVGLWGKMSVSQMLAHLNVAFELGDEKAYPPPNFLMKWIMKTFIKKHVVNSVPYPTNMRTAPYFVIGDERDFQKEKDKLIAHLNNVYNLGAEHFAGKNSHSFGPLTAIEWSNMFYKHLDHHLRQFDV